MGHLSEWAMYIWLQGILEGLLGWLQEHWQEWGIGGRPALWHIGWQSGGFISWHTGHQVLNPSPWCANDPLAEVNKILGLCEFFLLYYPLSPLNLPKKWLVGRMTYCQKIAAQFIFLGSFIVKSCLQKTNRCKCRTCPINWTTVQEAVVYTKVSGYMFEAFKDFMIRLHQQ